MASKCISQHSQLWFPSASLSPRDLGLQVHLQTRSITASRCISEFTRSLGLQAHLQTHLIVAVKRISEFTRSQSQSASSNMFDHSLHLHLHGAMAAVRRYRRNGGGQSDWEYIFGRLRSRFTSSHFYLILSYNENTHSIVPNIWSHSLCPRLNGSTQLHGSSMPGSIISSHLSSTLLEPVLLFLMNPVWMSGEVRRNVEGGLPAF